MIAGVLMAIGYWLMSQKISVPGSLPSSSMPGRIDFSNIFANEIATCTPKITTRVRISGYPIPKQWIFLYTAYKK